MSSLNDNAMKPPLENTPRVPRNITRSRIDNFMAGGGQFHSMGIHSGLWELRHSREPHVKLSFYSVPDMKRISFKEAVAQTFQDVGNKDERRFGPSWSTHWFLVQIVIPDKLDGREVVFQWDMDCEGLVWSTDGVPLQGLTGGSDQARHEYVLVQKAKAGDKHEFYIEAACNGMFGVGANDAMVPDPNRTFGIKKADLVVPAYQVQALYHDLSVIRGIAYDTEQDTARARQALSTVNEVVNHFHLHDSQAIQKCKEITDAFLSATNGSAQHQVTAIGNCHIDTAWLWPYDETKRKIARSWSNQLNLMERYPEYIFTGSQVQQYEWLKEIYPTVFNKIKEKEKTGQWEIIGGSWVEHDTNMPSGESLCRQMLLGQMFFERHFGKRTKVFWLPDSFGYSAQLPQVLKQSGCDYFFTQKLSWNNINKFPLTTFWWTGIDNTNVLAHLTPAETYTAQATPSEVYKCSKNHRDVENSNQSLLVYGHGDGGGGPTPEMLERLRRMNDVDGLPVCKPGKVINFFESLEKNAKSLQSYKGELYLEFHRGTYTTQAAVKASNRKSEVLVHDVEILATMAILAAKKKKTQDYKYPVDDITRIWKLICLNQFHDCLPGSAIGLAYKDVHKFYHDVHDVSLRLSHHAQDTIIAALASEKTLDAEQREGVNVFNTLPWPRTDVLSVPEKGTSWVGQQYEKEYEYVLAQNVPGLGTRGYEARSQDLAALDKADAAKAYRTENDTFVLENVNIKATFNADGQLIELVDKNSERASLLPEKAIGNALQLFEDVPTYWDAWDVEIYHLQKFKTLQGSKDIKVVAEGPLKAQLQFTQKISELSSIEQIISLTCVGNSIEFDNVVEWHESHQFLKVEFEWDIVSDHATYDIQHGVIRRPNHYNTTHDSARFEVCGHKFSDLSEANYGIALMNDSKYGYATHGNKQRLSLLRSPKGPDENADMGRHTFKYAIYPHRGDFAASDVVRKALELNTPLSVRYATGNNLQSGDHVPSLFKLDPPYQVIIDTVKLAEQSVEDGNIVILRLYEAYGGHHTVKMTSSLPVDRVVVSNILEDDTDQMLSKVDDHHVATIKPFQIMTLKVHLTL